MAIAAGASTINVPDTVGYTTPKELMGLMHHLRRTVRCGATLSIAQYGTQQYDKIDRGTVRCGVTLSIAQYRQARDCQVRCNLANNAVQQSAGLSGAAQPCH